MNKELIKITTNDKGERLVSGRELHKGLKVEKAFSTWIQTQLENIDAIENIDFTTIWRNKYGVKTEFKNNKYSMTAKGCSIDYILTVDIAKEICLLSLNSNRLSVESKKQANKIRNYLIDITDEGVQITFKTRKEIEFLDKLEELLKPINIIDGIRQYNVLNYKIDYYIPSLNIAIEYDENDHKYYTYDNQEGRQKEIENELNCKFIRVTDENSDEYNLGLIIKNIIKFKGVI